VMGVPCDTFVGGVAWAVARFLAGVLVLVMVLSGGWGLVVAEALCACSQGWRWSGAGIG